MTQDDVMILFAYNRWANNRILEAAANVSQDQLVAPTNVSHGTLRGALVHTLSAEWVWRQRCQEGLSPSTLLAEESFPTLVELRRRWQAEEEAWAVYLNTLDDDDLNHPIRYTNTRGKVFESTLWHILVHVFNHGTQFRSEAAVALTGYGQSPGDLDLILYLRES